MGTIKVIPLRHAYIPRIKSVAGYLHNYVMTHDIVIWSNKTRDIVILSTRIALVFNFEVFFYFRFFCN